MAEISVPMTRALGNRSATLLQSDISYTKSSQSNATVVLHLVPRERGERRAREGYEPSMGQNPAPVPRSTIFCGLSPIGALKYSPLSR